MSGGVVDGVGDGGSCADDADLADDPGPHRVGVRIGFTEPDRFDLVDVGVGCDVVAGEVVVDDVPEASVEDARKQR